TSTAELGFFDFEVLWRNRGTIATGAGAVALAVHGDKIIETAGNSLIKPAVTEAIRQVVAPAAKQFSAGSWIGLAAVAMLVPASLAALCWFMAGGPAIVQAVKWCFRFVPKKRRVTS
ncbi:MAG: hypothetical protein AAFN70_08215, partial [Planctomycetota bacterium]